MTIGDRVRSMTNDEMARIIERGVSFDLGRFFCNNEECEQLIDDYAIDIDQEMCTKCVLRWLNVDISEREFEEVIRVMTYG